LTGGHDDDVARAHHELTVSGGDRRLALLHDEALVVSWRWSAGPPPGGASTKIIEIPVPRCS